MKQVGATRRERLLQQTAATVRRQLHAERSAQPMRAVIPSKIHFGVSGRKSSEQFAGIDPYAREILIQAIGGIERDS